MSHALFASYFSRFIDHWSSTLRSQNAVVLSVIAVGIIGITIITFGIKKK